MYVRIVLCALFMLSFTVQQSTNFGNTGTASCNYISQPIQGGKGGGEGGGGKHHGPTQSQETYKSPLPIPSPPANLTSLAFIYPSRIPENRKKKMPAWTDVERLRMLLSIIDLLSSSARLPAWPDVANKMGVGYSAEGLRYFLPTLPLCVWF